MSPFRTLATTVRASERYSRYAVATVMLGTVMGPLDGSIANVAMPTIARFYHRGVDEAEWVLLAYMLVTASTLVLFGRIGDIFGHKRVYQTGFGIFGLGSLLCALAPSLEALIVMRVFQAIGAAMLVACTQALIVESVAPERRGRAIGLNGAAVAVGLTAGPILGGAIIALGDWRWIFAINIPISLLALLAASIVLKPTAPRREGFDPVGALLSIVGLFALSLALSRAHRWGWTSGTTLGWIALSGAALALFVFVERRVHAPTFDLTLFRSRIFAFSTIAAFCYFIAQSGIVFLVPLTAQLALHATPLQAGLLLVPLTALNVALAPTAGALSDRIPARYLSTAGAVLVAIGTLLLAHLPAVPTTLEIVLALVATGIGTTIFSQPNNNAIMSSAPHERRGIAAGTLATARTTGQLLGVATAGAFYFAHNGGAAAGTFLPASGYFAILTFGMVAVAILSYVRE
ncbi:MAG: MFS transporter [Candidatus Eremiobacteraeota bacterium]|uniref:Putative transporter MFS superfamily n=1 Tax=mine drainage metagenome TaxID=410659 RepID=E6PEI3_9ZZZZ|nr:MFS transporter [Candidatus Eremiobacteraeota bacterium]